MILDWSTSPEAAIDGRFDVCVAGAGPAGVTLARRLAERGKRVLLLEGGGDTYSDDSQDIYSGAVRGLDYADLDTARLRYFGGSSNHWGGRCRPLDAHDFAKRDDVPLSGWPIGPEALETHLADACRICGVGPFEPRRRPAPGTDALEETFFRWSIEAPFGNITDAGAVNFGTHWREEIAASDRITLLLNANLTDVTLSPERDRAQTAIAQGYGGQRLEATADAFVLAMGGLENVRFLLNANARAAGRLGDQGGMVGRCFLEHPHLPAGTFLVAERLFSLHTSWSLWLDSLHSRQKDEWILSPTPAFMRRESVMNCGVRLRRARRRALRPEELAGAPPFIANLVYDRDYFHVGELYVAYEQEPNLDSRVTLIDDVDRFGHRRIALDWRLTERDERTPIACVQEVGRMFLRSGLGRVRMADWMIGREDPPRYWGHHHMGGARMAETPETGVVDAECRVHGTDNLYVAGSAVFPTGGHANPTLAIVQLALRMAEHLAERG